MTNAYDDDSLTVEDIVEIANSRYSVVPSGIGWTILVGDSLYPRGWYLRRISAIRMTQLLKSEFILGATLIKD